MASKVVTTRQYQKLLKQNEKLKKQNEKLRIEALDAIDFGNYYRKCYNKMCNESYKHRDQIACLTSKLKQIRTLTFNL